MMAGVANGPDCAPWTGGPQAVWGPSMGTRNPTVAVIGASRDRGKYGNRSLRAHLAAGYEVFPVNPHETEIEGLKAYPSLAALPPVRLDRVTLYVRPSVALRVLEEIATRDVGEVWLNPGTDTPEVVARAEALGLNAIRACSLIDAMASQAEPGVE
jgi:predicted CoA-binding protein